jgi:hypothetical protein
MNADLFSPFVIGTAPSGSQVYIVWPDEGGVNVVPTDATTGQAHYHFIATQPVIGVYATVNMAGTNKDSFHYKIEGLTDWKTQIGQQTKGFEEIPLITIDYVEIGTPYTLKIQRREGNVLIDKLRIGGARFGGNGWIGGSSSSSSSSGGTSLTAGRASYKVSCEFCHGDRGQGVNDEFPSRIDPTKAAYEGMTMLDFILTQMAFCKPLPQCAVDITAYIKNGYKI